MADTWELQQGLDPGEAEDRNAFDLHPEYTNLEVYLDSLIAPVGVPSLGAAWLRLLAPAAFLLTGLALVAGLSRRSRAST